MWLNSLTRFWRELLRDVLLTGAGLAVIGSQVIATEPNPYLIGAGLSLTFPSTFVRVREILINPTGSDGGPGSSPAPRGEVPSPSSSGSTSGGTGE